MRDFEQYGIRAKRVLLYKSHSPMLGHAGVTHQNRLRYKNISQPQAFCGISIMSDMGNSTEQCTRGGCGFQSVENQTLIKLS